MTDKTPQTKKAAGREASVVERIVICVELSETVEHKTECGTVYEVEKWACPICKQEKSALYIDDEICHGEAKVTRYNSKSITEACFDCIESI